MGELAFSFERWASHETNWKMVDSHKTSSGLANTEFWDWPKVSGELVTQYKPDIVFVTMGPNDPQDMVVNKHWVHFGKDDWRDEYKARMHRFVDAAAKDGAKVYWVMPPVMRDSTLEKKMVTVRAVQLEALKEMPKVTVIDAGDAFVDSNGHYLQRAKVNGRLRDLRAPDGIHFTPAGADVMVGRAVDALTAGPASQSATTQVPSPGGKPL